MFDTQSSMGNPIYHTNVMMSLTPDQRQVILLKFFEGWNNASIAAAINKPVGAVKSLQHRALKALRRVLVDIGDNNEI